MKRLYVVLGSLKNSLTIIGLVLIAIPVLINPFDFVPEKINESTFRHSLLKIISDHSSDLLLSGFIFIAFSLLIKGLTEGALRIWNDHISKDIVNEIMESSKQTRQIISQSTIQEIVHSKDTDVDAIKNNLSSIFSKAYGKHCGNDQGLWSFVHNKMGKFYDPKLPHRSDYHQTVTVKVGENDSIIWHEVCSYKLHSVALDENYSDQTDIQGTSIPHEIRYGTKVKVAKLSFAEEAPDYHLVIKASKNDVDDKEVIFDSSKHLSLDAKSNNVVVNEGVKGVEVTQNGDELSITVTRPYNLESAWTNIEIKETSNIKDDYFISRRHEPTCGAKITMNLPDDWSFELISFGHPKDWTIHQYPPNTLSAWTQGWVLPGITFFCKWKKPDND